MTLQRWRTSFVPFTKFLFCIEPTLSCIYLTLYKLIRIFKMRSIIFCFCCPLLTYYWDWLEHIFARSYRWAYRSIKIVLSEDYFSVSNILHCYSLTKVKFTEYQLLFFTVLADFLYETKMVIYLLEEKKNRESCAKINYITYHFNYSCFKKLGLPTKILTIERRMVIENMKSVL